MSAKDSGRDGCLLVGIILMGLGPLSGCLNHVRPFELREQDVHVEPGLNLLTLEMGEGEPIVFVDDTPGNGTSWGMQIGYFAGEGYHAIEYGRRYDQSDSTVLVPPRSAKWQVKELSRLLDELDLKKVHLIGHSYGAYTALLFALEHRDRVRTLTLCEPPIYSWLEEADDTASPKALSLKAKLDSEMLRPVRAALESGDKKLAIQRFLDFTFEDGKSSGRLSLEVLQRYGMNADEFSAWMLSDDPYPSVDKEQVRKLTVPTLILSGALTTETNIFIEQQLDALLPEETHQRAVIPYASHWMWYDNEEASRKAVREFIESWSDDSEDN